MRNKKIIIGKGHYSVVIDAGQGRIFKYYNNKNEADNEESSLAFLNRLADEGVSFDFKIPKYFSRSNLDKIHFFDDKPYFCKAQMEKIEGMTLDKMIKNGSINPDEMGRKLAKMAHNMHSKLRVFVDRWKGSFGDQDRLLRHILNEKGKKVVNESQDSEIKRKVKHSMDYLIALQKTPIFQKKRGLSHLDLNFSNILINDSFNIEGVVDWGIFGFTHLSLPFYQMLHSDLWETFEQEFVALGGVLEKNILFAASVIHHAWAPFKLREIGLEYDFKKSKEYVKRFFSQFESHL